MEIPHLLDSLNKQQRQAVTAPLEHILVLAGAGSGKTKCLTHRIAWLLQTGQAYPHNILAVTFTNKAANEMRSRIDALLNQPTRGLWVGTFHGIAHRLLRIYWREANLPQLFQILDSDDQLRTLKRVIKALGLDEKTWSPKQAQHFINAHKDDGLRPKDIIADEQDVKLTQLLSIYRAYEETCQRTGIVDFAELLLRCYELLRDNPQLLEHYQQRFQHLHVDEFQDTNTIQYQWLRLLVGNEGKLFIVFDDDQSIFGWRGAKIENIQQLEKDCSDTHLIRLEQNYRSTGTILAAANALIANNQGRLGKKLWTQDKAGKPVFLYTAYSESDEAQFIAEKIQDWQGKRQDFAILYRTTAQSRQFEEALLQKNISYRIYGGLRFYERLEIKDMLAYLRLLLHRDDDGAFERVVNRPKRNIGDRTVAVLRGIARQQGLSLWQAARTAINSKQFKARASNSLAAFLQLIERLTEQVKDLPLHEQVEQVKIASGLVPHYQKESKEEAQRRTENLEELTNAARQFFPHPLDGEGRGEAKPGWEDLSEFLDHAALEAGERQGGRFDDCVQLMTLHSAKGLEFQVVFLAGLEEGLFPHQNSLEESKLQEERRLCYVGITRARQLLYLCHSESRYHYGKRDRCTPSRFLSEIPAGLIQEIRMRHPVSQFKKPVTPHDFQIGQRVKHRQL
ncbi:MAG: DNA helicase II [Candidatus Parabeggiatoa sp. nov. 2]|nr:MAG: DNA helicase II [Gammaproteobacteria bacterium]